jgi:DNA-binding transcriptional MocR family regulator
MQNAAQKWRPEIDVAAGPVYLSICAAMGRDIEAGRLNPGDRLPPQRELAEALGIDPGTVTRAYSEARRRGLIEAEGRRGSFVLERHRASALPSWAEIAPFDTGMNLPPIPAGSSFAERFADTVRDVLRGPAAANRMQYQPAGGAPVDRQAGAAWLSGRAIPASEENVLVTSGAQTALHAISNSILEPGDAVCTGPFVYPGWLSICLRRGMRIVRLEADAQGILPDSFARACHEDSIRAIYLVPTNENPTTATLPLARREAIAAIARQHDVAVIEDDPYCRLAATDIPPLASLAPERTWHVTSLSKMISPSLRIAYLRAPHVRDVLRLAADIHETTIMPPPLNMAVCTQWLQDGTWAHLVDQVRGECVARQEIVAGILPAGSYQAAREGYHLWVRTGAATNPLELMTLLQPLGVSIVSSESFSIGKDDIATRSIRLSIGGSLDREKLARALEMLDAILNHREGRISPLV